MQTRPRWIWIAACLAGCAPTPRSAPASQLPAASREASGAEAAPESGAAAQRSDATSDARDSTVVTAIVRFERFVERYPDSPEHTPPAMFRLMELYYERDRSRGDVATALPPDLRSAIAVGESLLDRFPAYERRTGVLHLLALSLIEAGLVERALAVLRHAVCPARFADRDAPLTEGSEPSAAEYAACAAAEPPVPLGAHLWMRIGELHFDFVGALPLARAAYEIAVADPAFELRPLALYKLGWTHYRLDEYAAAIARFAEVLTDDEPPELATEALQYIAVCLAEADWDGNGVPDSSEGGASVLERIADPGILPHDAPYRAAALRYLVEVLRGEDREELADRVEALVSSSESR